MKEKFGNKTFDFPNMGFKQCKQCKEILPIEKFTIYNMSCRKICKDCNLENLYEKKIEKHDIDGIFKFKIYSWKISAKKRGLDWDLTIEDLKKIPMNCYWTGMDLTFEKKKFNTLSIERLDNRVGYVPGNVVFCCAKINKMRGRSTAIDFLNLCRMVSKCHPI